MKWFHLFMATSCLGAQVSLLSTLNDGGLKGLGVRANSDQTEFFLWTDLKKNAAGGVHADSLVLGVVDWPYLSLARMTLKLPRSWDEAWNRSAQVKLKKTAKEARDWGVVTRIEDFEGWGLISEKRRSVGLGGALRDGFIFQRMGWEFALHHLSPTPSDSWFVRSEIEHFVAQAQLRLGGGSRSHGWDLLLVVEKAESRLPEPMIMLRLALSPQTWVEYWGAANFPKTLQVQNRLRIQGGGLSLTQDFDLKEEKGSASKELQTLVNFSPWGPREGIKLRGELLAQMGWNEWDFNAAKLSLGLDFKLTTILLSVVVQNRLTELWENPLLKAFLELNLQDLEVTVQVKHQDDNLSGSFILKLDHPKILATIQVPWEAKRGVKNWELSLGYRF